MYSVYALVDPRNEQVKYIGISNKAEIRFQAHLHCIGSTDVNKKKIAWIRDLIQNDLIPILSIIEKVETSIEAGERENYWIQHYLSLNVPLTNIKGASMGHAKYPARKRREHSEQDEYWTPKEIARLLTVSEETVRRYIRQKKLQAVRFGDQLRITDTALQEFIKKRNANQSE